MIEDSNGNNLKINGTHSHAPDAREVVKKRKLNEMKEAAKTSRENPRKIIANSVHDLTAATAATMPSTRALSRMIGRVRRNVNYPKNPRNLTELTLNDDFNKTSKGENFVLHDSGPNEKRLIVFGTTANLQSLSECESIYMDGTFSVAPPLFTQLYTIYGI